MIKPNGVYYVIALFCAAIIAGGSVPVFAGGLISHMAMSEAGAALPSVAGSVYSNPASGAFIGDRSFYMATRLGGASGGIEQQFAYSEPDNGLASGVLAWSKARDANGVDPISGKTLYDKSGNWSYLVAAPLEVMLTGGVAVHYRSVDSEQRGERGNGYRLDIGVIRRIDERLQIGLHIQGLTGNGIRWTNGDRTTDPQVVILGGAWMIDETRVAFDVVRNSDEDTTGFRVGGTTRVGDMRLMAGLKSDSGPWHWSAGVAYETGETTLEYAYVQESAVHMAGLSWRF